MLLRTHKMLLYNSCFNALLLNMDLPGFSGVFQSFPSEKRGVTKVQSIL